MKDTLEEWFADQIEDKYRVSKNARVYVNRASSAFGAHRLQELTRCTSIPLTRVCGPYKIARNFLFSHSSYLCAARKHPS